MANTKEGRLNELLLKMKHGRNVFRKITDFKKAVWARRIGVQGGKEVDFLLLNTKPPRIAVVECGNATTKDVKQIRCYCRQFVTEKSETLEQYIENSLHDKVRKPGVKTRGMSNRNSSLLKWWDKNKSKRILEKALSRPIIAILLCYVVMNPSGKFTLIKEARLHSPSDAWIRKARRKAEWRIVIVARQ